uniref:hypothetical protein n=1 Tax=Acinetobacter baumannii TaxID=470 RepID=UPI001C09D477
RSAMVAELPVAFATSRGNKSQPDLTPHGVSGASAGCRTALEKNFCHKGLRPDDPGRGWMTETAKPSVVVE